MVALPNDALPPDTTLESYLDRVRRHIRKVLKGESVHPTRELKINGMRSLQCEIHDSSQNGAIYLLTVVQGAKAYYQLIALTNSRPWEDYRPIFDKTIASFKENKTGEVEKPNRLTPGPTGDIPRGR